MKYIIAGASGFIGQALCQHFLLKGIECIAIGRDKQKLQNIFSPSVKAVSWQELDDIGLSLIQDADLIINLCGTNIAEARWSDARKEEILSSRITSTEKLANLMAKIGKDAPPLFNASAIGVYGLQTSTNNQLPPALTEETHIDFSTSSDFLSKIGRAWEHATHHAKESSVRVVNLRFAVVLGPNGGALKKMSLPFRFFLGGPIGNGQQAFSWVALADVIRAIDFLIDNPEIEGPVNLVAPECVTQKQLAENIGKVLHRPSIMPTPAMILKLIFGQMAEELLLSGQHVKPSVLTNYGFEFNYPTLYSALEYALKS